MRKSCSSDRKKLLKFKAEGREFCSLEYGSWNQECTSSGREHGQYGNMGCQIFKGGIEN